MPKKFLEGVVFGGGFALAFVAIWMIWTFGMTYFMPRIMGSSFTTNEPEFKKPVEAQDASPAPVGLPESKDFNFFKPSADRTKSPQGGGVLALSPMNTAKCSKRPSTYPLLLPE